MREVVKAFVGLVAETLPVQEPIYEFGSFQVPGQEGFADLRPLFPGKKYVGADMRPGPGVDAVLNLHDTGLPSGSAGTVLSLDTLEHVEYPREAMAEMRRVLAPEGMLVIASVMNFPIHDYPHDYWRFTPEAFRSLLKDFPARFAGMAGKRTFPHTVVGIGFAGPEPKGPMTAFAPRYEAWRAAWKKPEGERGFWRRLGLGGGK